MNWKEFLKPDKRKLITFLLIIALALVLTGVLRLLFCPAQESGTVSSDYGTSSNPFVILVENLDTFTSSVCITEHLLPRMLLRLPIYYLLACIGIFIYDKRIKKKSVK